MTPLTEYMKSERAAGKNQAKVAARLGISRSYLSEIASGAKKPSLDVAVRIERETGGAVPATSWIDLPPPGAPEQDAA